MAHLTKGILGAGSGKVGNVIMYTRYGKSFIRCKPSAKPKKTPARLAQQQKMALVHAFLKPAKKILKYTFKNEIKTRSPYQAAQSYHLKHAIAGEYPNQYLDMNKALVSKGDIELPNNIQFKASENGINITWDKTKQTSKAHHSDFLVMVWRYKNMEFIDYLAVGTRRSQGSYLWPKVKLSNLKEYSIWLAFRNWEETEYSNSHCLHIAQADE